MSEFPQLPPQSGGGYNGSEGYQPRQPPPGGWPIRNCYKCGAEGHIARNCPQAQPQPFGYGAYPQMPHHHHHRVHHHQHHHHHFHHQQQQHFQSPGGYGPPQHQHYQHHYHQHHHYQQQQPQPQQPYGGYIPPPHHHQHYQAIPPPSLPPPVSSPAPTPAAQKGPPRPLPAFKLVESSNDLLNACHTLAGCSVISLEALVTRGRDVSFLAIAPDDESCIYVIDVPAVSPALVTKLLHPLLSDADVVTLLFDIQKAAAFLLDGLKLHFGKPVDVQALALVQEWTACGRSQVRPISEVVERMLTMQALLPALEAVEKELKDDSLDIWVERPVTEVRLQYAAYSVCHYQSLYRHLRTSSKDNEAFAIRVKDARLMQHLAVQTGAQPMPPDPTVVEAMETMAGPGGQCPTCQRKGHTKAECRGIPPQDFAAGSGPAAGRATLHCDACGRLGHTREFCFQLNPEKMLNLVCSFCNKHGHTENRCFEKNPALRLTFQSGKRLREGM